MPSSPFFNFDHKSNNKQEQMITKIVLTNCAISQRITVNAFVQYNRIHFRQSLKVEMEWTANKRGKKKKKKDKQNMIIDIFL